MQLTHLSLVLHDDCVVVEVDPPVVCVVVELVPPAPLTTTVTDPLFPGEFHGVCCVSLGAVCVSLGTWSAPAGGDCVSLGAVCVSLVGPLGMKLSDAVPPEPVLLLSQAARTKPQQPRAMNINMRMN